MDCESGSDVDNGDEDNIPKSFFDNAIQLISSIRPLRLPTNYFLAANLLAQEYSHKMPFPLQTWCIESTAFHLLRHSAFKMSLNEAAAKFNLPDLIPSLCHFL
jgi:hypothetical protein